MAAGSSQASFRSQETPVKEGGRVPRGHVIVSDKWRGTELVQALQGQASMLFEDNLGVVDFYPSSEVGAVYITEGELASGTTYRRKLVKLRKAEKLHGVVLAEKTPTSDQYFTSLQKFAVLDLGLVLLPVISQTEAAGLLTQMVFLENKPTANQFRLKRKPQPLDPAILNTVQSIPRLGEVKAKQLLEKFNNIEQIACASVEMATSSRPELIATVPNFEWTEEREEDLIQLWEDNPFLYNTELKDYLNLYKKRETIEKFASILGATAEEVKRRMTSMRTSFTRILNKLSKGKSGSGAQTLTHRDIFYHTRLKFLQEYLRKSYSTTATEEPTVGEAADDDVMVQEHVRVASQSEEEYMQEEESQVNILQWPHYYPNEDSSGEERTLLVDGEERGYMRMGKSIGMPEEDVLTLDKLRSLAEEWEQRPQMKQYNACKSEAVPSTSTTSSKGKRSRNVSLYDEDTDSESDIQLSAPKVCKTNIGSNAEKNKTLNPVQKDVTVSDDIDKRTDMLVQVSSIINRTLSEDTDEVGTFAKLLAFKLRKVPDGPMRNKLMMFLLNATHEAIDGTWSGDKSTNHCCCTTNCSHCHSTEPPTPEPPSKPGPQNHVKKKD